MKKLMKFLKDEDGVTAVEYAVMVAFIAAVVILGATVLGTNVNTRLDTTATAVGPAGS